MVFCKSVESVVKNSAPVSFKKYFVMLLILCLVSNKSVTRHRPNVTEMLNLASPVLRSLPKVALHCYNLHEMYFSYILKYAVLDTGSRDSLL